MGEESARFGSLIHVVRSHRVILDADMARVYSVSTKALNQAVKRNASRFPADFAFRVSIEEAKKLGNRSQIVTSSQKHRSPLNRPWVFTEHGALMAANVLRSGRAIQMSVYLVRAFVRLREGLAANAAILRRLAEIDRDLLQHDTALRNIYGKLLPLLASPATTPKRRIGF